MKKSLLFLVISLLISQLLSQTPYRGCPDFTDLDADHVWKGYTTDDNFQDILNINTYVAGTKNNSHTVINTPGFDSNILPPYSLDQLPVWDGDSLEAVVRLNEPGKPDDSGYYSAGIVYSFIPDSAHSLLSIYLALVMQLPHEQYVENPTYQIKISDQNNTLIDSHSYFLLNTGYHRGFFYPNPSSKTHSVQWNIYKNGNDTELLWVDWSSVVFDLKDHIGREIRLEIIATGCTWGGHYGYGYYAAKGMPRSITTHESTEEEIVLKAPPGFISYEWYGPNRTLLDSGESNIYRTARDTNISVIQCDMVSRTGKTITMEIADFHYAVENDFAFIQSDAYCRKNIHFENTGNIRTMGDHPHALPLEIAEWDFGDGSPVIEGIHPCHVYENAGDYEVTCTLYSPDRVFKKAITKTVTVREVDGNLPADPEEIFGETNIVPQQTYTYYIEEVPDALTYAWTLTGQNWELSAGDSNRIQLRATGDGSAVLSVRAVNLCGYTQEINKEIHATPTGINETEKESVSIHPNPVKSKITITLPAGDQKTGLRIYDIMGREILEQNIKGKTATLDLSDLKAGIYFLRILDDQHITGTYKIIKE